MLVVHEQILPVDADGAAIIAAQDGDWIDEPLHSLMQDRGRSGFIGRRLERDGVRVTGVSRANRIDITKDALPLDDVDHVDHLGGLCFVADAWEDPIDYRLANAHGTVRVLDQCRHAGVSMTFISSYVYSSPAPIPVSERTPANPTNPYAFSKRAGRKATSDWRQ